MPKSYNAIGKQITIKLHSPHDGKGNWIVYMSMLCTTCELGYNCHVGYQIAKMDLEVVPEIVDCDMYRDKGVDNDKERNGTQDIPVH